MEKKTRKKTFKLIIIFCILICIAVGVFFGYKYFKDKIIIKDEIDTGNVLNSENNPENKAVEENIDSDKNNIKDVTNEEKNDTVKEDDNPITVGLYTQGSGGKILTPEYKSNWNRDEIIGMFYVLYTNKEKVSSNYTTAWNEYYKSYNNIDKYKIGYNIKYTLKSGDIIDKQILKPDDVPSLFSNLQLYLYDDVTPMPGRRYYHMTQPEVTDKTIYTSIKIVAYKETVNVVSNIELTVFTYDSEDDFDKVTGKYIGKSLYKTTISRK